MLSVCDGQGRGGAGRFSPGFRRSPPAGTVHYGCMTTVTLDGESLRQLVTEAQRGDRAAADELVREHDAWVRSVIYGITGRAALVDDIAQQVWTRAWERLPTLEDPRRLRAWLYTIARHTAIDMGMAQRRQQTTTATFDEEVAAPVPARRDEHSPVRAVVESEMRETLRRAVQSLPAMYREPFVLRHLEEWSYAQIGEVLDLPVDTVETRLVRARRLLREMLQGKVEP